jgi:activator of HSP90 ATPase
MENLFSRRRMALMLGGLTAVSAQAETVPGTIHFEVDFETGPEKIYQALLDAKLFLAFSKLPAEIDAHPGGAIKLFDGLIEGRNVELIANQRIVQAWRPRLSWPAGVYSIVRFELVARNGGTRIVFDHTGFPLDQQQSLTEGWENHYWGPLHKYLSA